MSYTERKRLGELREGGEREWRRQSSGMEWNVKKGKNERQIRD